MHKDDSIDAKVDRAVAAITESRVTARAASGAIALDVTADGRIHGIRITDEARAAGVDYVVTAITRLHNAALQEARARAAAAVDPLLDSRQWM